MDQVISLFRYNLPLAKGMVLHLNKFNGWNWPTGSVEGPLNFINVFTLFRDAGVIWLIYCRCGKKPYTINQSIPDGKGCGPSFKQTWIRLTQEYLMLWMKFSQNWSTSSGEDFFLFRQGIFTFSLLSPLGKGRGSSFEQTQFLSPKFALCQVWLKLAKLF